MVTANFIRSVSLRILAKNKQTTHPQMMVLQCIFGTYILKEMAYAL